MFYTIYDAIIFEAAKNGMKEEDVKKVLKKKGLTSKDVGLLKNNCTTLLPEELLSIIFIAVSYTHLTLPTKLEV